MKLLKYLLLLASTIGVSQQTTLVDFKNAKASITINPSDHKVSGSITYEFEVKSNIDTISIDAVNMTFANVKVNNKTVPFKTSSKALKLFNGYKKGKNTVTFDYSAVPKQTMYFTGEAENLQIWTQGQGKGTSHWLPSFDDMNEKVIFGLAITYDAGFEVISNGLLKDRNQTVGRTIWKYQMKKPMSSYLVMLAIGKFAKEIEKTASGTQLEMYYMPQDKAKVPYTYMHSRAIFDYFEKEIGIAYPWEDYRQVPVQDFLYAGMENTSATVFSQDYVVDEIGFNDRSYVNVNAHELAHQWFGDMVTAKSGKHHWLQEGFATYYALLAEKSLYGEDHFNYKMYQMAEELQRASGTDTIPILNEKASSLTFYRKGAWALHILREGMGAEKFRLAVKNYLIKYGFKNVETDDFLNEVNKVSSFDTKSFSKRWLEKGGFEVKEAIAILQKNEFMNQYFDILGLTDKPYPEKAERLSEILKSKAYYPVKEEVIYQTENVSFEEKESLLKLALQTNDIKVRQAVAKTVAKIPQSFYASYLTLLDDKSYITKEIALNALWKQFPEKQHELLNTTKGLIGFNDKNLRIQWLTLALITKDYEKTEKVKYYDELLDYASVNYESSVRENALEKLLFISPSDTNVLKLLVNPLTHHKWQFSKFAREKIRESIKREAHRQYFTKLISEFPENERLQLNRLLEEK